MKVIYSPLVKCSTETNSTTENWLNMGFLQGGIQSKDSDITTWTNIHWTLHCARNIAKQYLWLQCVLNTWKDSMLLHTHCHPDGYQVDCHITFKRAHGNTKDNILNPSVVSAPHTPSCPCTLSHASHILKVLSTDSFPTIELLH